MSSNSTFGFNKSELEPFNHNSSYSPYQNYGKSKMLMEQKIRSFSTKKGVFLLLDLLGFMGLDNQPDKIDFFQ